MTSAIMNPILSRFTSALALGLGIITLASETAEAQGFANRGRRTWTIERSGTYNLRRDFTVREGNAIVINASNVTLNLNGFSIRTNQPGTGSGIVINDASAVTVKGGKINGFETNVSTTGAENVTLTDLQITGRGLAPDGGPSEIGIMIVNSRACTVRRNNISSVNLGIFVRGGESVGNRIEKNVVVGGATAAHNLFGICYNPAPEADDAGPRGDSIYNNHIARFNYAISVSDGSIANIFVDNTLSSFTGPFRDTSVFETQGGTNAEFDNASTLIPADDL